MQIIVIWVGLLGLMVGCSEPDSLSKNEVSASLTLPYDEARDIQIELNALAAEIASERPLEFLYRHAVTILGQVRHLQTSVSEQHALCNNENKLLNSSINKLAKTTELQLDLDALFTQIKEKNTMPLCWYGNAAAWHLVNAVLLLKHGDVSKSAYHVQLARLHFEQFSHSLMRVLKAKQSNTTLSTS